MDSEPNNSLDSASFLTFLTMTGGGSINSVISGETLHSADDPADYFYFTHKDGLKQVTVSVDLTTVADRLDDGGVYGETRTVTIAPQVGATGDTIAIERVVGSDAYGDEWTVLWQQTFTATMAAIVAASNGVAGAQQDADYGNRALEAANKILEADLINVDPHALGQQIKSEFSTGVFTQHGEAIREAILALAELYLIWETPIYRDAVTKAVLGSGAKTATWTTSGQSSAFKVTGGLEMTAFDGLRRDDLNVPSIQIFVKAEEGAKLPTPNSDNLKGTSGPDSLDMLSGNDTVDGGKGNDTLLGNVGNDSIRGGEGNDVLDGGPGKDTVDGGAGDDTIRGNFQEDTLLGGSGKDSIDAFDGKDSIDAGSGNDTVLAGRGDDTVKGGDGDDFANGEAGKDTIAMGGGRDTVWAGAGDDNVDGDGGNDELLGEGGKDTLDGGAGNDTLIGGAGKDNLSGGAGKDVFVYLDAAHSRGSSADTIIDFDRSGNDAINLEAIFGGTLTFRGKKDFNGVGQVRIEDVSGADVVVEVNLDGNLSTAELKIRLASISASTVKADDFFL